MALRGRAEACKTPEPDGRAAVCKTADAGSTPAGVSHHPLRRSRASAVSAGIPSGNPSEASQSFSRLPVQAYCRRKSLNPASFCLVRREPARRDDESRRAGTRERTDLSTERVHAPLDLPLRVVQEAGASRADLTHRDRADVRSTCPGQARLPSDRVSTSPGDRFTERSSRGFLLGTPGIASCRLIFALCT